jgi:CelD/BcsL family acetyltransferase involved in cellulose biosynthesis
MVYHLDTENFSDYRGKVFFIYDIPEFLEVEQHTRSPLRLTKVRQYIGYLSDLEGIRDVASFMQKNFSSKSRWRINKSIRSLESCFDITYEVLYGDQVSKEYYDEIFEAYRGLLEKRFSEKEITNHYLHPRKWAYLKEVVYPMIIKERAAIFIIKSQGKPISINLNYMSDKIMFSALPSMDIDYYKFNIGYVMTTKLFEWCIERGITVYDFSKGDFEYKRRWSSLTYSFDYHILYDSRSFSATIIAQGLIGLYRFKQFLRKYDIHTLYHRMTYYFKPQNWSRRKLPEPITVENVPDSISYQESDQINLMETKYDPIRKAIYDFLYRSGEHVNSVKVYKISNTTGSFLIKTENNQTMIVKQ